MSAIEPPVAATYVEGAALDFVVVYDRALQVTGVPTLSLSLGSGVVVPALFAEQMAPNRLRFRRVVALGDNAQAGVTPVSPLQLAGGSISAAAGGPASLILPTTGFPGVVIDTQPPSIVEVTGTTAGAYRAGTTVPFEVRFSRPVSVSTAGGTPSLRLQLAPLQREAVFREALAPNRLVFDYLVQAGDSAPSGIAVSSPLQLNGGLIRDTLSRNLVPDFAPLSFPGVRIDTAAPQVLSASTTPGTYGIGQSIDVEVVFDEPVQVSVADGLPALRLRVGTADIDAPYVSGSGTDRIVFRYVVDRGDMDEDGVVALQLALPAPASLTDAAGNPASTSALAIVLGGVLIDGEVPGPFLVTVPPPGSYRAGVPLSFAIDYTAPLQVSLAGGTPRLALQVGGTTVFAAYQPLESSSTRLVFRYVVQPGVMDLDGIAVVPVVDPNGGLVTAAGGAPIDLSFVAPDTSGIVIDTVAPQVVSVAGPSPGTYVAASVLSFAVDFDEPVSFVGSPPRLELTIGSTTRHAAYLSGAGGASLVFGYTVQPEDVDPDGIVVISPLDLNGGTLVDTAGNAAAPGFVVPDTSGVLIGAP